MKIALCVLACMALVAGGSAATLSDFNGIGDLSSSGVNTNFSITGNWANSGEMSFSGGLLTVGSTAATSDNGFIYASMASGSYAYTAGDVLNYSAVVNSGNLSSKFVIIFSDSEGNAALKAEIITTGWIASTPMIGTAALVTVGTGNANDISYFDIAGDGTANAFRMSFDQMSISAVPEPAAYAALLGVGAMGLVVWRKRRKA